MPSKLPHTTIRFEDEIREQLREYCQRTRLSLTAAVNLLVGEALHNDHTQREQRHAWNEAGKKYAPARQPAGDPSVCGTCDTGYYGESCPKCNP